MDDDPNFQMAQSAVIDAWTSVLQSAPADSQENFFAVGGTSLTAVKLGDAVEKKLGIAFPMRVLFLDGRLSEVVDECVRLLSASDGVAQRGR